MNIQSRLNQVEKRLSKKSGKKTFRTALFVSKDGDDNMYDYFDWKEKGVYTKIDREKYQNIEGITVYVKAVGYIPPNLKREDYG